MVMSFLGKYLDASKRQSSRGRCLHFDSGERCKEIISAHSIQKMGQLQHIAEDNHVYRMSADISTLRKTNGKPLPKRVGIGKASTFPGFCKPHDNAVFEPIDNFPLFPSLEQIALYSFRCLCREYFVKENMVQVLKGSFDSKSFHRNDEQFLSETLRGASLGLEGLKHHKYYYDNALRAHLHGEFEYVCFKSTSRCSLQLSGLLYPDFDFLGRKIQDLSDWSTPPGLITFFTAPTNTGWAFVFAWHTSSGYFCRPFIKSLAQRISQGANPEDLILRFVFSCCENHAIRISWWDGLSEQSKQAILDKVCLMIDPDVLIPSDYLVSGCEGLADWTFDEVLAGY